MRSANAQYSPSDHPESAKVGVPTAPSRQSAAAAIPARCSSVLRVKPAASSMSVESGTILLRESGEAILAIRAPPSGRETPHELPGEIANAPGRAFRADALSVAPTHVRRTAGFENRVMTATQTPIAVRSFTDLSRIDVPSAGGKGANLGELTRAGLPVPPGLVVGAPAYAAFCDQSCLRERVAAISVNSDVIDRTRRLVAAAEQRLLLEA